jgi:type IV secretory pathway TraG/TraD family ATPase VirD4
LDEVTQICPVPLPAWLSDSGGKGIQVVAVVHGEAQLAGRWGDHGRQVVLDTSSVKVLLPGITDTTTLEMASVLCGQASWRLKGQDHASHHPIATPDMIRQLPAGFALVIRGGLAPVTARLPRAWNNPAYRRERRRRRFTLAPDWLPPVGEPTLGAFPGDLPPEQQDPGDDGSFSWSRP